MKSGHRYVLLDGMRGAAALVVLLCHAIPVTPNPLPHAGVAVDFFFVLSGFVLAHAYDRKLVGGDISCTAFLRIRLIRLYPLVALGAALATGPLLGYLVSAGDAGALMRGGVYALGSFSFIPLPTQLLAPPSYFGDTVFLNSPEWSLFYELLINIAYAALAVRLTSRKLLLAIAIGALGLMLQPFYFDKIGLGWATFVSGGPRVLFSFSVGVLLVRLAQNDRQRNWPPLAVGALFLALCACLVAPGHYGDIIGVGLTLVASPAIVWLASKARLGPSAAAVADWAGRLSFPVYILHRPLLWLLGPRVALITDSRLALLVEIVCIVGISSVALVIFDEPVRARLSRPRGLTIHAAAA